MNKMSIKDMESNLTGALKVIQGRNGCAVFTKDE